MFNSLKNALLTGLYVLLPILLLWIGLREIGGLLTAMAEPIADLIGSKYFDALVLPGLVAAILIAGTSLVIGFLSKLGVVAALAHKIESVILMRIPMYQALKVICGALVRPDEDNVSPALVLDGDGGGDPCYVMEEHGNGMATVLLPWSPASFAGSIKVVPTSRLRYLGCTVDEYSRSVSLMGVGVAECIDRKSHQPDQSGRPGPTTIGD